MNEQALKEGAANLQVGIETVGGRLQLLPAKLLFSPRKFNVQRGVVEIDLSKVERVDECWTKFLGFLPIFPNALRVHTKNDNYVFTVFGRKVWIDAINQAKAA